MQQQTNQQQTRADALEVGRSAYDRHAWSAACAALASADHAAPLAPEDLERLGLATYLIGNYSESDEFLARAHRDFLARDDAERAVRCALWLTFRLLHRGEHARGSGWLARARRLLEDAQIDCVECGYLLAIDATHKVFAGDFVASFELFTEAASQADRFHDTDLSALARHGQGRALMKQGDVARGVVLLDEAMVAVEAGEVSPVVAGEVYCSVIEACTETFDLHRAQEWTASLRRWCEAQPDLVPFRGQCMIRRAEILRLHGAWDDAMAEAEQARVRLSEPPPPQRAVGLALYQQAELHRLRGEFAHADATYGEASRWSRKPWPGLALLRLSQGDIDAARVMIASLLEQAQEREMRPHVLAAAVEIACAAKDVAAARAAADELAGLAADVDAPLLVALAAHAAGAVMVAEGDAGGALAVLQRAWRMWEELEVPHEAARVRLLIGRACRQLGDEDTAAMEFDAAAWVFRRLGAAPDLARVNELLEPQPTQKRAGALTPRELEVLRLVAQGKTNKAIAAELFISERTVHRHVSNIFRKLGLSTRAAATAYAFEQQLV